MKFELIPVGKDDYGQTEYGLYITKNEILKAFDKDKGSCLEKLSTTIVSPGLILSFNLLSSGLEIFVPEIFSVKISVHPYLFNKSNCLFNSCDFVLTLA